MTPKIQRISIAVIAAVMVIGTLGSFAVMIIANDNILAENKQAQEDYVAELQKQQKEQEELSSRYFPILNEFAGRPAPFDAEAVGDEVTFIDLKEGDGEVINKDSIYRAFYIGWNPKGKVFESSIKGESLSRPLDVTPGYLLSGWYSGVDGMKMGGVREITLPSDLAYGETGKGDDIPPNTPIKFIVLAIPVAE